MGNLIVHNGTNLPIIVEVSKDGQPIKQKSEIKIQSGSCSTPIPLKSGVYDVTATSELSKGRTASETQTVIIPEKDDKICNFPKIPLEKEESVKPNLINR